MLVNPDARFALQLLGWDEHQETDKSVMTGQRGKMTRRGLENLVEKYRAKRLEDLTYHSLRHTFCKNLVLTTALGSPVFYNGIN
jgi:site-specific recombinase XerD